MLKFQVFGTVYRDWEASVADVRGRACGFTRYTPWYTIRCGSIEAVPEMFVDLHGHELDRLHGYPYLYVLTENGCLRITE